MEATLNEPVTPASPTKHTEPASQNPTAERSLPEEVWILVFRWLGRCHLDQVRLVCRDWNRIVSSTPALMDNYVVKDIGHGTATNEHGLLQMVLSSSSKFTTVTLWRSSMEDQLNFWQPAWDVFGESIQTLNIGGSGKPPTDVLLSLLQKSTNLRSLYLISVDRETCSAPVDFQLNNLRKLELAVDQDVEDISMFHRIFPRMTQLTLRDRHRLQSDSKYEAAAVAFVDTVGHMLQELNIHVTNDLLERLCGIQMPHLEKLSLEGENHSHELVTRFVKSCSTIKELELLEEEFKDVTILHDLCQHFPNLKSFKIGISSDPSAEECYTLSFLKHMPHLESLEVLSAFDGDQSEERWLDPTDSGSPQLTTLKLCRLGIMRSTLETYLRNSPHIRVIHLEECCFPFAADIISIATQLQSLEHLKLWAPQVDSVDSNLSWEWFEHQSNIKFLTLEGPFYMAGEKFLITLLKVCPAIETLYCRAMELDDEIFTAIRKNLRRLKRLELLSCEFTARGLENLTKHHSEALEELLVTGQPVGAAVKKILKDMRGVNTRCP